MNPSRLRATRPAELGFDFGDTLTEDETLSYRFVGLVRDAEKEYGASRNDETFLLGGLTWRPGPATSLSFVVDHLDRDGVPGSGGYPAGIDFDRDAFFGEPDFNYRTGERTTGTLILEHDFGGGLSMRSSARYSDTESDFGYAYITGASAAGDTIASRAFFANDSTDEDLVADTRLRYDAEFGALASTTILGFEYRDSREDGATYFTGAPDIDYIDPVYTGGLDLSTLAPFNASVRDTTDRALYLQQNFDYDRVTAVLGLRHDDIEIRERSRTTGAVTRAEIGETTARAGLTYRITPGLSAYASYAESVVPAGLGVQPEEGTQYEIGVKYRPEGTRALFTAALYDLSKTNITRTDSLGRPSTIGEIQVRGLDLEAKADLADLLALTAALPVLDAEIVEDGVTANGGNTPQLVPEALASLGVDYTLPGSVRRGDMTFGLGLRLTGSYFYTDANTAGTESNVIVDAAYSYEIREDMALSVNVDNLFDEKFVAYGGFGADFYNPGREVSATLRYSW